MSAGHTEAAERTIPPKYNPEIVAQVVLLRVIKHHPTRLTIDELALGIVSDPGDDREVETVTDATRELRRACLVRYRNDDELVEPTQAGLRAHSLLLGK